MKKIIRLTESDLTRIVRRVIKEQSNNSFIVDIENATGDYKIIESFVDWAMQFGSVEELKYDIERLSKNPEPWFKKVVGAISRKKDDQTLRRKQLKQISRRYQIQQSVEKNKKALGTIGTLLYAGLVTFILVTLEKMGTFDDFKKN